MTARSEVIRAYIIDQVEKNPHEIGRMVAQNFGISRQAVNRHMKTLIEDGIIEARGTTRNRLYSLKTTIIEHALLLAEFNEEDRVWSQFVAPVVQDHKPNVVNMLYYGFTEMFNNAIDHSDGIVAVIKILKTEKYVTLIVFDDGVGIFEKIRSRFNLADHREAILELSKGKLTTDPVRHTGQGIFFTSRIYDEFFIMSDGLTFVHTQNQDDWLIETDTSRNPGTCIVMRITCDSVRTNKEVFDRFADLESDDYAFSKTHVPLSLAKYGGEQLISRSQAKRVLSRFEKFEEVFLDFHGVDSVGQSFADEIFRVFRKSHPEVRIVAINANVSVKAMISRAESIMSDPSALP